MHKLPRPLRERLARNKRDQYRRDPEYRLKRINARRARDGSPLIASLDEAGKRYPREAR